MRFHRCKPRHDAPVDTITRCERCGQAWRRAQGWGGPNVWERSTTAAATAWARAVIAAQEQGVEPLSGRHDEAKLHRLLDEFQGFR